MLNENIKALKKSKGMSQEALAARLNVVRQTISKWEQGLSVPDSDMLISIAEVFETPVSVLLGETTVESSPDTLKALSEKLETINLQLAMIRSKRRSRLHWLFVSSGIIIVIAFICLKALNSPYLRWDYSDPETAFIGVAFHAFEWFFIRLSPAFIAGASAGAYLTRKKT